MGSDESTRASNQDAIHRARLREWIGPRRDFAGIAVFQRQKIARKAAYLCAITVLIWLVVQVAIIGYVSWMQPATAVAAVIILLLTSKLSAR